MRFLPEGPNIPDELLEERDSGNVVFLCGAGVSYPAGMPDFLGLAKYVIKELGTPQDAPSREMLSMWEDEHIPTGARPSLDQIFNLLQQEYQPAEIDDLIAKRLKTKPRTSLAAHETILRLSSSADRKPQVVTTNFDLLFEKAANRNVRAHVAPALPDLAGMQSLDGIVYLHGRLNHRIKRGDGRHDLVVSSSDFGRAYLAEGWATRFVRDLLDQYIVVLLGYSASDPPVRYLLQGLHTRGRGRRARLFTFDSGTEEDVQHRWRDSGVQALAYLSTGADHSVLWNTLSAWAERADHPLAWRQEVVKLARKGPRNLSPHERGQVASLVRSDAGAKLFADADPPAPGEWLCVFDHHVRYGDIGRDPTELQPNFDPLVEYRLDDDPPRPAKDLTPVTPPGDDLLSLRSTSLPDDIRMRLTSAPNGSSVPLPARLAQLARWIGSIVSEPATAWWAAKYLTLHPYLLDQIELHVEQIHEGLRPLARSTWRLLIDKSHTRLDDADADDAWYEWRAHLNTDGWTNGVLRSFERVAEPYLTTRLPTGLNRARPPAEDWSKLCRSDITEFDVAFPETRRDRPNVPDEVLPAVYQALRKHLGLAAALFTDIERGYLKTRTFYPENKPGKTYLDKPSAYLFWFRELFDRMVEAHPEQIRADIALWPTEEPFFFDKLRLYAWASDVLFSGKSVGERLLALSDGAFWETQHRRELLHLLRPRWRDLPSSKRRQLERRIANGRAKYRHESQEDYHARRSSDSATMLGWLDRNGCQLGKATLDTLRRLRNANPHWRPEWDEAADESFDGGGGFVKTFSDPARIINAPLDKIIPLAEQHTVHSFSELTNYRPFDGLVKQRPRKAVAALTYEARKGKFPIGFWSSTLQNWPDKAPARLVRLLAERLARLPTKTVVQLQDYLFLWLREHFSKLVAHDRNRALSILDAFLDKVFEGGSETSHGAIALRDKPRGTIDHGIARAVDESVTLLLSLLKRTPKKRSGIPSEIRGRLERLMTAPREGADRAVYAIARHLRRLDHIDPEWTHSTVIPWFDLEHPASEPAWNGFLEGYDMSLPEPRLFSLLKPHFLKAFTQQAKPRLNGHGFLRLHEFLVFACFRHRHNTAYISYDETRDALQRTDEEGRTHSINYLNHDLLDRNLTRWKRFGKVFLRKAWPREDRFRTEQLSRELAELAAKAGESFPEVVDTILPYLIPIFSGGLFVTPLVQENGEEEDTLATRFPDAVLALIDKLVPDNPSQIPYKLDIVIEMIAEAKPSLRQDSRWRRLNDVVLKR